MLSILKINILRKLHPEEASAYMAKHESPINLLTQW